MKTCHTCGVTKPLDEFYRSHKFRKWNCIPCYNAARRGKQPHKKRDPAACQARLAVLRSNRTGLSSDEQRALFEFQRGACALCLTALTFNAAALDHDHHTGAARGFLCMGCNTGLGKLGDTVQSLEIALEYLRTPPASLVPAAAPRA